jgi:Holliday junction resolvase
MGNKAKAKGTAFETLVVKYLRPRGFAKAFRPATSGSYDSGDINGITNPSRQAIIQCKNHRQFNLSGWLNDAVQQAQQDAVGNNALPVVVFKRPGIGEKNLGDTYALMRLEDIASLLKEAGYT